MSDFPDFLKSDAAAWRWAEANVDLSIDEDNTTIAQMQRDEYESKALDYASFAREAASLGQLTIYRAVCVPEPTVIQTHNLGKAWSRYAKTAGCYGGGAQGDRKVVITGVVSVADVDWAYGFTSFMYYGEDQWEVSLDGNAPVLVTAIDGKKCETPIAGNTGRASEEWRAAEGRRALAWGAVEAGDSVPLTKLYAWAPKLQETWDDVQAGRVSKTDGPVRLTHLDSPRGAFFVLDGHHRVIEAILRGDTTIRFAVDAYVPRIERTGGAHRQIVEEKRNVVEFVREQAAHVAREAAIPSTWYHLTDRARFKLDPNFAPSDNAVAIEDRSGRPGIYLGQSVEKWVNGFGYWRPFVVEFKVDPSVVNDPGVHGRYGGEMFVPASSFDKLTILRVIPIDAYAREEFGEPGWIESDLGVEFDTGAPLQARYKGYRYPGPDVRQMSPDELARLKKQMRQVKGVAAAPVEEARARPNAGAPVGRREIPPEIQAVMPDLVRVAQREYDSWQQDAEGYDEELGSGGICHLIADKMAGILSDENVMCTTVSSSHEVHVYVVVKLPSGVWNVDIRPHVYERGGGYTWKKIPNVSFEESDVEVDRLSPFPEDFGEYVDDV